MLNLRNESFILPEIQPLYIDQVNIGKIVIPDELPFIKNDTKYLIDYKNNGEVTALCVLLPKMSRYVKNFDDAKTMSLLVENE